MYETVNTTRSNDYREDVKDIRRGEMYWVWDVQEDKNTKQIKKSSRPAIIVSNDDFNKRGFEVEVVYLTNKPMDDLKTHVTIRSTGLTSTALCEKISTVNRNKIGNFIGTISADEMSQLEICLMISLDLSYPAASAPEKAQEAPDRNPRKQVQDGYEAACLEEIAKNKQEIAWLNSELRKSEQKEREANAKLLMIQEELKEANAEMDKLRAKVELLKEMHNELLTKFIIR